MKNIKNVIVAVLVTFVGFSVQAQDKKNKNAKYTIEVNGNCEQCQKRIQKTAFTVPGVKSAVWSIETHQLSLILNEEKSSLLIFQTLRHSKQNMKHETEISDEYSQANSTDVPKQGTY